MFKNAIADIKRYSIEHERSGFIKRMIYLLFRQDLHAVIIYRFGRWANDECKFPIIRYLFKILYFFLRKCSDIIISGGIWPESQIGPGLNVHYSGFYIKAKIGSNCSIGQHVIIGHIGGFRGGGVPTLGDNVYVGAGAKILGDVTIGSNVNVGANAVVITDIPDNAVAVGIPAKVVKSRTISESSNE